jgi:hypothetical protein
LNDSRAAFCWTFTAYSRGWESQVTSAVKDLIETEARGIAEFASDHMPAFGKR